jgi:glutamate synthase (NADPH/NADH) small chain
LELEGSKIKVNALFETSVKNVWAGGDCVSAGDDLTVTAVAQGRDAAENIHSKLMGEG